MLSLGVLLLAGSMQGLTAERASYTRLTEVTLQKGLRAIHTTGTAAVDAAAVHIGGRCSTAGTGRRSEGLRKGGQHCETLRCQSRGADLSGDRVGPRGDERGRGRLRETVDLRWSPAAVRFFDALGGDSR